MEPDRFKNNHFIYITGMICLILCLLLFFFSLYIIPFLIWNFHYTVPSVIFYITSYMADNYNYTPAGSNFIAWLVFFIPSLVFGVASYFISNHIDNQIYTEEEMGSEPEKEDESVDPAEKQRIIRESASLGGKIIVLMVLIVAAILILQLLIQL